MNYTELTKMILAVLVVLTMLVATVLYLVGMVTITPEVAAVMAYLTGEARPILMSYFKEKEPQK